MNRFIMMLTIAVSTAGMGQSVTLTSPRAAFTNQSSSYPMYLWNSNAPTLQEVLNQPCPSSTFAPAVYQWDPNPTMDAPFSVFSTDMSTYTYLNNVTISSFDVRICYHVVGLVSRSLILIPVLRDMNTGIVWEAGSNQIIWSGYYTLGAFGSIPQQFATTWNISGWPLTSQELSNGRVQFGVRVKYLSPTPPEVVDSTTVKIHSISYKGTYTTQTVTSLGTPGIQYTSNPTFSSGSIKVTTNRPYPSSQQGGLVQIRCANGQFRQILSWNQEYIQSGQYTNTMSINYINTIACSDAPLFRGGTTAVRTQARATNGAPTGDLGTSGSVFLN